jgi:hypothetical protein
VAPKLYFSLAVVTMAVAYITREVRVTASDKFTQTYNKKELITAVRSFIVQPLEDNNG